jgi:hypothetical protein
MPKPKTRGSRKTRRSHKKRTIRRKLRKTHRGGYDPVQDNGSYPTVMKGYPVLSNWQLPDPAFLENGPLKQI